MKKIISLIAFYLCLFTNGYTQQTTDLNQAFLAAESYYLFEEYEEALPLYLRIHRTNPDNYNLYFKIGVCYLNNPYDKAKSVFYLEKASDNINPKYKDSNFKEHGAPLDALFFLGNAYRVTNELAKARDAYKKFQSKMDPEVYDNNLVEEQLAACDAAEKLMEIPVDMDVEILSNKINTRFADKNPAVSGDETKMVFISKLQFYDAVFYTEMKNGEWSPPRNITPELGVDGDVYPTCLSYDGSLLFIYRNDDFTGNLYTSALVNGLWTPLVKMNELINTKYWESHASITKDDNTLYFTSNRKGGFGGLDIYKSTKLPDGNWGEPINLGPSVNTAYNEETPFISENGKKLFFSSYGHYNIGGYDVFMSVLKADGSWTSPLNMGYPVNSTDDDIFFCPVKDGEIAYYPLFKETGYGKFDIYRYQVYNVDNPRKYDISGILNYSGQSISGSLVSISAISKKSGETLSSIHPDDSGRFTLNLPAGRYSMVFETDNFEKEIKSLEVSQNTPHPGLILKEQIILSPLKRKLSREEMNQKLQIADTLLIVNSIKLIEIEYEAEKGSVVIIRQYLDSVLVKTDTVLIGQRMQNFGFQPVQGLNKLEFLLTDNAGNQIIKSVTIDYPKVADIKPDMPRDLIFSGIAKNQDVIDESIPQFNINALTNELASRSEGRLKIILESIDLQKEGITNTSELFKYLYDNAEKLGYSSDDIDHLLIDMVSKKDQGEFIAQLINASEGPLKTAISQLDLKANNINTSDQVINYLLKNPENFLYKPEDIIKALAIISSGDDSDLKFFNNRLIHSADEGPLKVYLKGLDLSAPEKSTPEEFAADLYRKSTDKGFTGTDVIMALTNLAINREALDVQNKLIVLAERHVLKDYLTKFNLENEDIYTSEEIIAHLFANADLKDYTTENLDILLHEYLYNQISEIDDLRLKMAALASGNLKYYLENTNLNEQSFGSREEFINFLYAEATKNGFSAKDINYTLLKLSYTGDQDDIIKIMILHSDGNLRIALENLDPGKEGITSFDGLIRYLLSNSVQFDYSGDDVYKLLADYTTAVDMELFLNKLIQLSDPETRVFLDAINLKENNIYSRSDLVYYCLKKASEEDVSQDKIISLLLVAGDIKVIDILTKLQSRSVGELNKLLNSEKLPIKKFNNAADLYEYLIAASHKNKDILQTEIAKLFSESLFDDSLEQFLLRLVKHSDGKIRKYLLKINLKDSGISSVSELISFLNSNSLQNGFNQDDVFRLIESILGQGRLIDFVANLKEVAPIGLKKLLCELNMEESGIRNIEELMNYLAGHATEYGYTIEDVWNSILQLVISGEDKARIGLKSDISESPVSMGRALVYTAGFFGLLSIIILILSLIKRKKDN